VEAARRRVEQDLGEVVGKLERSSAAYELSVTAVQKRMRELTKKRAEAEKIRDELGDLDVMTLIRGVSVLFPRRGVRELILPSVHPRLVCEYWEIWVRRIYWRDTKVVFLCFQVGLIT
jgi:hypothetical protein